ncbi:MAG: hypothetical protein FJ100_16270 [Deltaproteobacteria bacterium]|nr:hypothetical protein [Deltaproteobacteria bacterium]
MRQLALAVIAAGMFACKAPAVAASTGDTGAVAAASDSDSKVAESSTQISLDLLVSADASVDADEIDAQPDGDGMPLLDGDAAAAADDVSPSIWGWAPCAVELIPGLPLPGEPCAVLGQRRCTDFKAHPSGGVSEDGITGYCNRPNFVECAPDKDGKLYWALNSCTAQALAIATPEQKKTCDIYYMRCIDHGNGMSCRMRQVTPKLNFSYTATIACRPELLGKTACFSALSECQKFQNGEFAVNFPNPKYETQSNPLGVCAPFAEGATYWMPVTQCDWYEIQECPNWKSTTKAYCDLYDGVYRCSKTCAEALATLAKIKPGSP